MSFLASKLVAASAQSFRFSDLFVDGSPGMAFGAWEGAKVWTDTGGTSAAVLTDDVARVDDLSGNGHNLVQATGANQPVLEADANGFRCLTFDGVTEYMTTSSIDLSSADVVTMVLALYRSSSSELVHYASHGAANAQGSLGIMNTGIARWLLEWRNPSSALQRTVIRAGITVDTAVLTVVYNVGTGVLRLRYSGTGNFHVDITPTVDTLTSPTDAAFVLGADGAFSELAAMSAYGGLIIGKELPENAMRAAEVFLGKRCGVATG